MRFAVVDGKKLEATRGAKGSCPNCGAELIAKCGEIKVNHWAHKGKRTCDPWWENETVWHRSWKSEFAEDWQEVVQRAEDGEKHIADVKTDEGWVLEFQHSYLNPEERRAREKFYPKLAWVVDGLRRKSDKKQFYDECLGALGHCLRLSNRPHTIKPLLPEWTKLLREWRGCRGPVFFDFGELDEKSGEPLLWCLLPMRQKEDWFLVWFSKSWFIQLAREKALEAAIEKLYVDAQKIWRLFQAKRESERYAMNFRLRRPRPRRAWPRM